MEILAPLFLFLSLSLLHLFQGYQKKIETTNSDSPTNSESINSVSPSMASGEIPNVVSSSQNINENENQSDLMENANLDENQSEVQHQQQSLQGLEFLPPQTARDLIACYTSSKTHATSIAISFHLIGAYLEIINYFIQYHKRFRQRTIVINGRECKFTFSGIMEIEFIDSTLSLPFKDGKFKSLAKINLQRRNTENYYNSNNKTIPDIDENKLLLYRDALRYKQSNPVGKPRSKSPKKRAASKGKGKGKEKANDDNDNTESTQISDGALARVAGGENDNVCKKKNILFFFFFFFSFILAQLLFYFMSYLLGKSCKFRYWCKFTSSCKTIT